MRMRKECGGGGGGGIFGAPNDLDTAPGKEEPPQKFLVMKFRFVGNNDKQNEVSTNDLPNNVTSIYKHRKYSDVTTKMFVPE